MKISGFRFNQLTYFSFILLEDILKDNIILTQLYLNNNYVTNEGFTVLYYFLIDNKFLEKKLVLK